MFKIKPHKNAQQMHLYVIWLQAEVIKNHKPVAGLTSEIYYVYICVHGPKSRFQAERTGLCGKLFISLCYILSEAHAHL